MKLVIWHGKGSTDQSAQYATETVKDPSGKIVSIGIEVIKLWYENMRRRVNKD